MRCEANSIGSGTWGSVAEAFGKGLDLALILLQEVEQQFTELFGV